MTDITNFGSSFPNFGSNERQSFGGFRMKGLASKKRGDDTERELAKLLQDLEHIDTGTASSGNPRQSKNQHWLFWRNPDEDGETDLNRNSGIVEKQNTNLFKKAVAGISAAFAGIQSISIVNSVAGSSSGMFFGIFNSVDSLLRAFGVAMAIGCGSLPFVVYAFQIGGQGGANTSDSKPAVSSTFRPHDGWYKRSRFETVDRVDPYATRDYDSQKAIMSNGRGLPKAANPDETDGSLKPTAPEAQPYVVKDVVNGMAMIEYGQGYWFARPGSKLPDGSYYVRVMKDSQSGKVALKTSRGIVPVGH
ncbi:MULTISPECIES: hypothetical protein [Bartonella]|uniref:hypothetical protein n=1 Tax=Bartonella TaxID=773 RepID=UPI0018DDDFCE|nr:MULTISPECIES: hypothetical protein [Bartonella]MBH9974332.1 hypothetical protein [Bartonella choladocola]MBI0013939.1 hypothetical protein [Bartonella sp. B10834G3]